MGGEATSRMQLHAIVSGRVQGIGYRHFVVNAAYECGLTGYVRNLHSGDVEVLAEGHEDDLRSLIGALWRGPEFARVEQVRVNWGEATDDYSRFRVTY